jgi:RNA polymerase sigma-70 factor (ECF subfamily)
VAISASEIEACYARVERGMFNVLYRLLWDAPACQDVMHDAFLRLWSARARLHAARIDALAYATALNLARNRLRGGKMRRWVGLEELDAATSFSGVDEEKRAELHDLRNALARLDPADREILLLSEYAGFDTGELAAMLRIAAGTVGSRKHRALARLRELTGEQRNAE